MAYSWISWNDRQLYTFILLYYCLGWMLGYFIKYVTGDITKNTDSSQMFADVTANPWIMFVWMAVIVLIAVIVCSMGLQNGAEVQNI